MPTIICPMCIEPTAHFEVLIDLWEHHCRNCNTILETDGHGTRYARRRHPEHGAWQVVYQRRSNSALEQEIVGVKRAATRRPGYEPNNIFDRRSLGWDPNRRVGGFTI